MTEKLGSQTIYYASQKSFSYKDCNKINFNEFLALKSPSEALSLYPYYYCDTVITNLGFLRPAKKIHVHSVRKRWCGEDYNDGN